MGLIIPIGIAKVLFHWLTFWGAFKALKVPKTRKKIPRMAFQRNDPLTIPRTPPTLKALTKVQKERRTQIKAMTQVCLVWVIWTRLKLLIDWVAWAIPFYDEIHLLSLIWMIVMGPTSAEFLFDHCIKRFASPYEQSFDAILGTMHDFLVIVIYLITCGPNYLVKEFGKWKARQFNKSLLSARAAAPPSRLPSRKLSQFHTKPNPSGSAPTNSHLESYTRAEKNSSLPNSSLPTTRTRYPSLGPTPWEIPKQPGPTTKAPQRKPTLSRKLSSSYKRSVSNSSLRSVLEHRNSYNLPKKNEVRNLENRLKSKPPLATAHLNTLKEPKPMIFGNAKMNLPAIQPNVTKQGSTKENQHFCLQENSNDPSELISPLVNSSQQDEEDLKAFFRDNSTELSKVYELSEDQIGNNSLIIHDNISEPADPTIGLPWSATSDCVASQSRKRTQRTDDEDFSETCDNPLETRREGSVQVVSPPSLGFRSSIGMPSSPVPDSNLLGAPPTKRQKVLSSPSDASSESSDEDADYDSMALDSLSSEQFVEPVHQDETVKCDMSTWYSAPNAAIPRPDQTLSPTKAPAPNVKRRLHNPDEPLPTHGQSLETVLKSLKGLESDPTLPSTNRAKKSSNLGPRISGYLQNISKQSPTNRRRENLEDSKKRLTSNQKINSTLNSKSDWKRRASSVSKGAIPGKLGEEKSVQARLKYQALNSSRTERQNHDQRDWCEDYREVILEGKLGMKNKFEVFI
ncbi:uncharacterized protein MELLADRAFT_105415 [Melampsora larici-populina 98AG31]|uniref:Uncharacterized protein n=1 Tax=Melampsora larici-populina (strain 98AG31 / pathotype 3-4-7) TaxID=747676 RepID=F4RI25_MELLP|nr:uncharacterized protein MELLADRAFT_105415 [Melampsora larici-populina 98AG31]EGG08031.1 hypothetical protein MELLADRAFT_105415 [Melampsora larici-populina 98AG31]